MKLNALHRSRSNDVRPVHGRRLDGTQSGAKAHSRADVARQTPDRARDTFEAPARRPVDLGGGASVALSPSPADSTAQLRQLIDADMKLAERERTLVDAGFAV